MFPLDARVLGFEPLKSLYAEDRDFGELFNECKRYPKGKFLVQEGYLFKAHSFLSQIVEQESF